MPAQRQYLELGEGDDESRLAGRADFKTVAVSIPVGAEPGQTLQATDSSGFTFAFTVPAGVKPGQLLRVEVPPRAKKQAVVQVCVFVFGNTILCLHASVHIQSA